MTTTLIPEEEWILIQSLVEKINRRSQEQEDDVGNLNNLLHAIHGEGVRCPEYTKNGKAAVFVNGKWVSR